MLPMDCLPDYSFSKAGVASASQHPLLTSIVVRLKTIIPERETLMPVENETNVTVEGAETQSPASTSEPKKPRAPRQKRASAASQSETSAKAAKPARQPRKKRGEAAAVPAEAAAAASTAAPVAVKGPRKPRAVKPAAPDVEASVAASDEFADLIQLEEENKRLRQALSEKLRKENADLRRKLGVS
jgi:hypothetical protein